MTLPITAPKPLGPSPSVASQTVQAVVTGGWRIVNACDDWIMKLQAGPVPADLFFDALGRINRAIGNFDAYRVTPGLDEAAHNLIPGYGGSLSADIAATVTAMQNVSTTIINGVPKDANGWVLVFKWAVDGTQTARTFSPAQTAPLVTALQGVKATIG